MTAVKPAYAVLWMDTDDAEGLVYTLVYRKGHPDSEVRTYHEGRLDIRAGNERTMKRFTSSATPLDVLIWMRANLEEKCLVDVRIAKDIYGDNETFADPV